MCTHLRTGTALDETARLAAVAVDADPLHEGRLAAGALAGVEGDFGHGPAARDGVPDAAGRAEVGGAAPVAKGLGALVEVGAGGAGGAGLAALLALGDARGGVDAGAELDGQLGAVGVEVGDGVGHAVDRLGKGGLHGGGEERDGGDGLHGD